MKILCTDLEGTLTPEIWEEIGIEFKIEKLKLTTRDCADFEELMDIRMKALRQNNISYKRIVNFVQKIEPFEGAKSFLNSIRNDYQIIIVSDAFYQIALPVVKKLGDFPILCHSLKIENDKIVGFKKRQEHPKKSVVQGFKSMNFECFCIGDSFNDIQMIDESDGAFIFAPPEVKERRPKIPAFEDYECLKKYITNE